MGYAMSWPLQRSLHAAFALAVPKHLYLHTAIIPSIPLAPGDRGLADSMRRDLSQ